MKPQELREKNVEELKQLLQQKQDEMRGYRFQVYERQLQNMTKMRQTRKDIARIQTVLKNK